MIKKMLQHIAATGGLIRNKIVWGIIAGIIIGLCVSQYVLLPMVTV